MDRYSFSPLVDATIMAAIEDRPERNDATL